MRLELGVDTERRPRHACDDLDRAVVVRRSEPPRDEAHVRLGSRAQRCLEIGRMVTDYQDPLGRQAERERLSCVEGPVAVGSLAAHELAARDDDRRARTRAHPLTAVAPETVSRPCGSSR